MRGCCRIVLGAILQQPFMIKTFMMKSERYMGKRMERNLYKNNLYIRKAAPSDVDDMYHVMRTAYECLEDKTWYLCDEIEYVREHVGGLQEQTQEQLRERAWEYAEKSTQAESKGFGVVACNAAGTIAGCLLLRFPGEAEDNLGRDIGLNTADCAMVVHMESAAVLPQFRGQKLQYRMLMYAEELLDKKRYRYCMATVSPENQPSRSTLLKAGYQEIIRKEKYEGLMRCIMLKEI